MKRAIYKTRLFEQQLDEQLEWYIHYSNNIRVPERFLEAVEKSISEIAEKPDLFSRYYPIQEFEILNQFNFHYKRIDKHFPYYIYYQFDDDTVIIRYLWHERRDRERLILENLD